MSVNVHSFIPSFLYFHFHGDKADTRYPSQNGSCRLATIFFFRMDNLRTPYMCGTRGAEKGEFSNILLISHHYINCVFVLEIFKNTAIAILLYDNDYYF